jgi:hypothetical protein
MHHLLATREAFEGRLKSMSGLEFIVAQEPAEMAPGTGTGVWVIRKQTRRKRPGQEDEIVVHSTYFVMGENIYMAPAVGDVIGSRLVGLFNPCPLTILIVPALNIHLAQQIHFHSSLPPRLHSRPRPHLPSSSPSLLLQSHRIPTPSSKQRSHPHARLPTTQQHKKNPLPLSEHKRLRLVSTPKRIP